jgi:hypothetical protein
VKDPFGAVVTLLKADTAVAALVGTRVSSEIGELMPCVEVIDSAATKRPFGPGSGRMGMQLWLGRARCWAADSPTGAITARQLAGAVSDAIHNQRPTTVGTAYIARAYAPDIDGLDRDPATRRPYYDVPISVYAAADAVS